MADDWVIVDTCVWASFFSKHGSPENRCVEQLLNQDRVTVIGPIVVEVLTGFREFRSEVVHPVGDGVQAVPGLGEQDRVAAVGAELVDVAVAVVDEHVARPGHQPLLAADQEVGAHRTPSRSIRMWRIMSRDADVTAE